jgi:hypothetical protein
MQINYDELNEILKNEPIERHSYFQLKYFLIGKEPTIQSKMWQCIKELSSRNQSLQDLKLQIDDTKDKKNLLDISVEKIKLELAEVRKQQKTAFFELEEKELEIRIRQTQRKIQLCENSLLELEKKQKSIIEECVFFMETFKNLNKIEALKHFDDLEAQKQYWSEKLGHKINLKMISSGSLDSELVETVLALPDDMPIKQEIVNLINFKHANMMKVMEETKKNIGKEI